MNGVGPIQGNLDRIGTRPVDMSPIRTPASSTSGAFELGASASAMNLLQIQSSVQHLLQSVGGGVENDQNLKMLIGLLILMALLQNPEQSGSGLQRSLDALGQLGVGASGEARGGFSYEYQQTTSITLISEQYESIRFEGTTGPGAGGHLDAIG